MSTAVGSEATVREVLAPLTALDADGRSVTLKTGSLLRNCRVVCVQHGIDPYVVEFEAGGRRFSCPLFAFQPRTQATADPAEERLAI